MSSGIHPPALLGPGRYLLDRSGRLHDAGFNGVHAVAVVNVLDYLKSERRTAEERATTQAAVSLESAAERIRRECAAEAAEHEARQREASRLTTAHPIPVEAWSEERTRAMARRARPAPVIVPPAELPQPTEEDAAVAEFEAKLKVVRARRAKQAPTKTEPKVDGRAIAAAHRAKTLGPAAKKAPTRRALSDGECHRCGVRTTIGCDHFLPYLGDG